MSVMEFKQKILIVDSDTPYMNNLRESLSSLHVEIETSDTGNDAVFKTMRDNYSLLFVNAVMPDMNGFETVEYIRREQENRDIPVLFTAPDKSFTTIPREYEVGVADFIPREITTDELLNRAQFYLAFSRQNEALKRSQKILRKAESIAHVGNWEFDIKKNVFLFSDEMYAIYGIDRIISPINLNNIISNIIHPEDRQMVQDYMEQAIKLEESSSLVYRIVRPNGTVRWISAERPEVVQYDNHHNPEILVGTAQDITTQKETELEIKEKNKKLEILNERQKQSNAELESFAYAASHDLKSPLRAIRNIAEWIEEDLEEIIPDESKTQFTLLHDRVNRMEDLLNSLLEYSRVGKVIGSLSMVSVDDVFENITALLSAPREFQIKLLKKGITFQSFRVPLEQVLRNLIDNAIKYHNRNDGMIEVNVEEEGNFYKFSVIDNGPGIPKQYREQVFELFRKLTSKDKVDGTGMGLAMVKKSVESFGGHIYCEDNKYQGTTFCFTWPQCIKESVSPSK